MTNRQRNVHGYTRFVLGFLLGMALPVVGVRAYFKFGKPPVTVTDKQLPFEGLLLRHPVNQRIDRELTGPPFGSGEDVFVAGARLYMAECASCHGTPGHDSGFARTMYPRPTQLWRKGGPENVLGVTQTETGRTYWKIAHGIRLSGMPSYADSLTETEMWQVTLLLKHADGPLSEPVTKLLSP